jgi:predicted kinase
MALIIMVMGLPGSGKSFFARRLSISLNAVYLGSDELRKQMGMMGKYQKQYKFKVYEVMIQEAENYLKKDLTVVLDATFYLKAIREKVAEIAKVYGAVCIPILVEAEEAVIKERLSKPRVDSEADWEVYQKLKTEFEPLDGPLLTLRSDNENIDAMIDQAMQYINLHYGKS